MGKKRLFVIDTMAMAFRNYHAFGMRPLTTSEGLPTSAVFGCANYLMKLIRDEQPDYLLAATDSKEKTFRHELYPAYKANRTEMPEDLAEQIPYIYRLLETMKIPVLKEPGYEADDFIGSVAEQFKRPGLEIYIVSGDKDFMQLIDDQTFLYTPKKGGINLTVDCDGVKEKFGCAPEQVIDVLALMGDSSDNVPGVKGIGEKGAAKLIQAYGSIENIYKNLDKITAKRQRTSLEGSRDIAELSKQLVTIKTDIPLHVKIEELDFSPTNSLANLELKALFEELEFNHLANQIGKTLDAVNTGGSGGADSLDGATQPPIFRQAFSCH